jgi:hypothetical protein
MMFLGPVIVLLDDDPCMTDEDGKEDDELEDGDVGEGIVIAAFKACFKVGDVS